VRERQPRAPPQAPSSATARADAVEGYRAPPTPARTAPAQAAPARTAPRSGSTTEAEDDGAEEEDDDDNADSVSSGGRSPRAQEGDGPAFIRSVPWDSDIAAEDRAAARRTLATFRQGMSPYVRLSTTVMGLVTVQTKRYVRFARGDAAAIPATAGLEPSPTPLGRQDIFVGQLLHAYDAALRGREAKSACARQRRCRVPAGCGLALAARLEPLRGPLEVTAATEAALLELARTFYVPPAVVSMPRPELDAVVLVLLAAYVGARARARRGRGAATR